MLYLKKSLFGILFLISFAGLNFLITPLLSSYEWIFGVDQSSFFQMFTLSILLLLSAILFVLFAALSNDKRIGLTITIIGALTPLLFSQNSFGVLMTGLFLLALVINYFMVENTMKHYFNFSPVTLLIPHIKTLSTMLLFIICIGYYLSINVVIKEKGFSIPESIIPDAVIQQIISQQAGQFVQGSKYIAQLPQLTPEQLELLKQNPDVLRSYGVDPAILEQYESTTPTTEETQTRPTTNSVQTPTTTGQTSPNLSMIKKMALSPINNLINDYQFLVAPLLAIILFSAFSFFFFIFFLFNLISGGTIKSIFYIMQKTNFIRFEKEMREVQKLVV